MKNHIKNLEKKIMCISLVLLIGTTIINPNAITFAFADFEEIQAVFNEKLSDDKLTSSIQLVIDQRENQEIKSVQLPDGTKVAKADFKKNEEEKYVFDFTANENKELEYVVEYIENSETVPADDTAVPEGQEAVQENQELKTKTLKFEVSDLKTLDDMKLDITAEDVSFKLGEKVDFKKGITIINEDSENITDSLSFDIVNYNGFSENNPGTYKIEYNTKHPISQQEYAFSRKIEVITDSSNEKNAKEIQGNKSIKSVTNNSKVKIALSSNNAVLKNPEDFIIGSKSQDSFNVLVQYETPIGESNRNLKITLPEGFELSKAPTMDQISQANSIKVEGNQIIIDFSDGVNVVSAFEVGVKQNVSALYREASEHSLDKEFIVEGSSDKDTISNNLILHVDEFDENEYQFQMKTAYDIDDVKTIQKDGNVHFTYTYKREAYKKSDNGSKIFIPKSIGNLGLDTSITKRSGYANDVNCYLKIESVDDETYGISFPNDGSELEEIEYVVNLYYTGIIASNKYYESNIDLYTNFYAKKESKGKITIDTLKTEEINNISKNEKSDILIDGYSKAFDMPKFSMNKPYAYVVDSLTYIYEIPYELVFVNGSLPTSSGNSYTIYTNTGEVYRGGKLKDGEYISRIEATRKNMTGYDQSISTNMKFYLRNTHEDGSPVLNDEHVKIKVTAKSSDTNIKSDSTSELDIKIINTKSDDIQLIRNSSYDKQKSYQLLSSGYIGGASLIRGSEDTKVYKNAEIVFEGAELLSLVDEIRIRDINYAYGLIDASFLNEMTIVYSTNKKENIELKVGAENVLNLEEDEYVTALKVKINKIDPTFNAFLNRANNKYQDLELINLYGKNFEDKLPSNGEQLSGYYNFKSYFRADDSKEQSFESTTPTFLANKPQNTLSSSDNSDSKKDLRNYDIYSIGQVRIGKQDAEHGAFKYDDLELKINIDPIALACINEISGDAAGVTAHVGTSKGRELLIDLTRLPIGGPHRFNLDEDEYVTSLMLKSEHFISDNNIYLYLNGTARNLSKTDYDFIGTDYKSYDIELEMSASNLNEVYKADGKTASLSGFYLIDLRGDLRLDSYYLGNQKKYQAEQFHVEVAEFIPLLVPQNGYTSTEMNNITKSIKVNNPTFYFIIDKDYLYVENTLKDFTIDGVKSEIEFQRNKTVNGDSVLKVQIPGEYNFYDISKIRNSEFEGFDLMVSPNAEPKMNSDPIKTVFMDIGTIDREQESYIAGYHLTNAVKDTISFQDDNTKMFIEGYTDSYNKIDILEANEMGIGNYASTENQMGLEVTGHDNTSFKQELVITSNYSVATKDWIVYVPVPKKDSTVKYIEKKDGESIITNSEPSKYNLELSEKVDLSVFPEGTTVSYSIDENPSYSLDGNIVGNYSKTIDDSELSKVTMIKIEIPKLAAKQKIYPVINFKVSDTKKIIGSQVDYGAAYYNMKLEGSDDYAIQGTGGYSKPIQYNLIDFNISGNVWEELDEPSNNIYSDNDKSMEGVKVKVTDKDSNVFEANTDNNGNYSLAVPSHGETEVKVILPNDETMNPKQLYSLVEKDKDKEHNSSVFDQTSATKIVTLLHDDVLNINAGLWAERAVSVNPNDLTVIKGQTVNVPAIAFPSYAKISYQNAKETNIASVDANGVVTGLELGTTTATVTIPDGKGGDGVVTATYNIKVVPTGTPSMESTSIIKFVDEDYDPTEGVEIRDSDSKIIDPKDTSKVSIDTSSVDSSKYGRYPIIYTIDDGYNKAVFTRYICFYSKPYLEIQDDIILKVNNVVNVNDYIEAYWYKVDETDGSVHKMKLSPIVVNMDFYGQSEFTSSTPKEFDLQIFADVKKYNVKGNFKITFHGETELKTEKDNVIIKVGSSMEEIKASINANAEMGIPNGKEDLTDFINWDFLDGFDTNEEGNTITGTIYVIDPDNGKKVEKEITITVSKTVTITAPAVIEKVVGDAYDPMNSISITDGDGNEVELTADMVTSNVPLKDGKTTTRGNYKVTYTYTDKYGNSKQVDTIVKVHSPVKITVDERKDIMREDLYKEEQGEASYQNSDGQWIKVEVTHDKTVDVSKVGLTVISYKAQHPINGVETTADLKVYVHGTAEITVPDLRYVKVGTEVTTAEGVKATYQYVEDDGTISIRDAKIEFEKDEELFEEEKFTSSIPQDYEMNVVAYAEFNVPSGSYFNYAAEKSYHVIFNGLPEIKVTNPEITVRVGATIEEIEDILNASASVQYGDEAKVTDITQDIDWNEVEKIDTSKDGSDYKVKINVTDRDGAKAEQELVIHVSKNIAANLPIVNKVVGDKYSPTEDVTIIDGSGNIVDLKDVTIDDSKVDMNKPGNYEVTYSYTDNLGNKLSVTNTIHVHGDIQFENLDRIDLIREDNAIYTPNTGTAFYINSDGDKIYVDGTYKESIDQSKVGLTKSEFTVTHPINAAIKTDKQNVYVHGEVIITTPKDKTVKVNTEISPTEGATGTYKLVEDDGTIIEKTVHVTSGIADTYTSTIPSVNDIPLSAEVEIVSGLISQAEASYRVTFNGMPEITVVNPSIVVKVNATLEDIQRLLQAQASVRYGEDSAFTNLTNDIDWNEVKAIDTSKADKTHTVKIYVTDRDGAKAEKELIIKVSKNMSANLPVVNKIVGDTYDPAENVTITDGNGNPVNMKDVTIDDSKVDMNKPGNYDVTYSYKDSLGNEITVINTIHVHGKLQFENLDRIDLIREDDKTYTPNTGTVYYINSDGNKIAVDGSYQQDIDQSIVGLSNVEFKATHPVNLNEYQSEQKVYVHGELFITAPENKTVKVNTEIDPVKGATASYKFVEDDGTIKDKTVDVTTVLDNPYTSPTAAVKDIPLSASVEVVKGLISSASASYKITFNGMPEITVTNPEITVRVGAEFSEIKDILNAQAFILYGGDAKATDLTKEIDWNEVKAIDTSKNGSDYKVKIFVTDKDGVKAEKEITIHISDDILANLPIVNKVVGEKFDPKEDVTIIDGSGNKVDMNDVTIDDSKVDTSKPGNYEVTYKYTDSLGNDLNVKNTVHVHGAIQFEGLDRVDLEEKTALYVPDSGKAYYVNSDGKKVYVNGSYDKNIDQSNIGLDTVTFNAVHPINHAAVTGKQNVYVHGSIKFEKPEMPTYKIGDKADPTDKVVATFKKVNDDGTITTEKVDVTSVKNDITLNEVGYAEGIIEAATEVHGLKITGKDTVKIAFDAYPYIESVGNITVDANKVTLEELRVMMNASAGMMKADGSTLDLTRDIDYINLRGVKLDTAGNYIVVLQVEDPAGYKALKTVNVTVVQTVPVQPIVPAPNDPVNPPVVPSIPAQPSNPVQPVTPVVPNTPVVSPETPVERPETPEDTYAVISKDVPLSEAEKGVTNDLVKSYITASSELKGNVDFEIISHTVEAKIGTYEATVRFADGTVKTVKINVVEDSVPNVQKPQFGRDDDCIIHWIILLLLLGYSIYSIAAIVKRHKDIKDAEKELEELVENSEITVTENQDNEVSSLEENKDTEEKGVK